MNGAEGLAWALSDQFDAAVVDIMMPELDGISLITNTEKVVVFQLPVLVSQCQNSEIEERVRGLNAGADDYLTKPFAFTETLRASDGACPPSEGHGRIDTLSSCQFESGSPFTPGFGAIAKQIELQPREF